MADTPYDGIEALLQNFLKEETVRAFDPKLASSNYTVATLLEMSEEEVDEIMDEEFSEAAKGDRKGFNKAILSQKRKPTLEGGSDSDKILRVMKEYFQNQTKRHKTALTSIAVGDVDEEQLWKSEVQEKCVPCCTVDVDDLLDRERPLVADL